MTGWLTDHF